jgi:hypothetical protein
MNLNAQGTEFLGEFLVPRYHRPEHFTWNQLGISSNRVGKHERTHGAHTRKIVQIHYKGILRNAAKYGSLSVSAEIYVGNGRFSTGSVSMQEKTVFRRIPIHIGEYLAKCPGKKTRFESLDGCFDL